MNKKGVTLIEVVVSVIILALLALGVSATISLMSGRRGTTGTRDLQAANYAREVLEELKNAVSANATRAAFLEDTQTGGAIASGGTTSNPGDGTVYDRNNGNNTLAAFADLPSGALKDQYGGKRKYEVWDIDEDQDGVTDFQKVTATVEWEEA